MVEKGLLSEIQRAQTANCHKEMDEFIKMSAFCWKEGMIEKLTDGGNIIVMFNRPESVFRIYKGL